MNRIKFLGFALVAVGLWGYHLVVAPAAALRASEQSGGAVAGAGAAVALRIEQQRSELQAAMVRLQANPASWNVGPRGAGPTPERFGAVRGVLLEALGESNRAQLVVLLVNDQGALAAQGPGDPTAPPAGFDVGLVVQGGAQGSVASYGSGIYLFYATPVLVSDKNEVRTAGTAVAGLPLLPDQKKLEQVARELKLSTLAILSQNTVKVAAGPEKVVADQAARAIKPGQIGALASGPVRELGPLSLPLFVEGSALSMGARQAIAGTPFEVIAVASTREPLEALAAYQLFGLGSLLGLVLLAAAVAVLIKPEDEGGGRMVAPPPMPLPPAKREDAPPAPIAVAGASHGPEGNPDDFQFPSSAVSAVHAFASVSGNVPPRPGEKKDAPPAPAKTSTLPTFTPAAGPPPPPPNLGPPPAANPAPPPPASVDSPPVASGPSLTPSEWGEPPSSGMHERVVGVLEPEGDPFAPAATEPMPSQPVVRPSSTALPRASVGPRPVPFATEEAPTVGGPTFQGDPFAGALAPPPEPIKPARQSAPGARPTSSQLPRAPSAGGPDAEERHYQDVFKDFVATREKCGEAADGLTYERFKVKLLKNRDQLLAKYQCRTVRFQVYVKEGKAALKASPVRD